MRAHEFITEGGYPIDQDTIDLIKIYTDEGKTPKEIAKALNLQISKVHNILARYYPERKNKILNLVLALTDNDKQEIVSKFKNGEDLHKLSRSYGISRPAAASIIKNILGQEEYNYEIIQRQLTRGKQLPNKITPEMMDTIRKLYVTGMTLNDISVAVDNIVTGQAIDYAIRRDKDFEQLHAARLERKRKINTGGVATTGFTRPGEIDVGRIKGPNSRHRSGVDWPKYGE